jgi:hypothetical protein
LDSIRTSTYSEALNEINITNTKNPHQSKTPPTQENNKIKGKNKYTLSKSISNPNDKPPQQQNNLHNNNPTLFNIPATIKTILNHHQEPLQASPWSFERTMEAATKNTMLLHTLNFDVEKATQSTPNTILSYGSEFRPTHIIKPLLQYHPQWPIVESIINNGANYPLIPITEKDRINDIEYMINRGNHQSTKPTENKAALDKAFDKEVKAHWAIPLNPSVVKMIPGASITPLGVATQWTVNTSNERVQKRRVTHDCTFPGASGNSCNKRVIPELLEECRYGHALKRFLHGILNIRKQHPNKIILMSKTDMDAAYRRIHASMKSAVTCITIVQDIAYLLVRLPFGSSPAPSIFSIISDTITDVAWDLSLDPTWCPKSLHSSFEFINNPPTYLSEAIPFEHANNLTVPLPPREIVSDNFIDDIFQAGVDINDNAERLKHSVPLALEAFFRPIDSRDATPRKEIISITKHLAEGTLSERKVVLGWLIDSRRLRVFLPEEKANDWLIDISKCITTSHCSKGLLETIIGRLNHIGTIIHISRYFLTRLRFRLRKYNDKHKKFSIHLAPWDIDDLKLWKFFITHVQKTGVSINNICITSITATTYSDACEWGMGGFTSQGHAWRYQIPTHLQLRASINLLEFIASIITVDLSINMDKHNTKYPNILAYTDSSSALGWLYHSTFNPVKDLQHDKVARHFANLLFKNEATIYPEHIPGKHNVIADSLSRDFHLTNIQIIHLFYNSQDCSQQRPSNLKILQLPKTTISWIASILESLSQKEQSLPQPAASTLAASNSSKNFSPTATSLTHSLTNLPQIKKPLSSPASHIASATITTNLPPNPYSPEALLMPPSPTWYRPSGKTSGQTQP